MTLLLIIVVLVLLFGGGGYYGYRANPGWGPLPGGLMLVLFVMLLLYLVFGSPYAHAEETTVTASGPASATTTISLVPVWAQMVPYIAAGVGSLVVAFCGWLASKLTNKQISDSNKQGIYLAASSVAGRLFHLLDGKVAATATIDVRSPWVAAEIDKTVPLIADKLKAEGMTPENFGNTVLGAFGKLQAVAQSGSTPAPAATPAAPVSL